MCVVLFLWVNVQPPETEVHQPVAGSQEMIIKNIYPQKSIHQANSDTGNF